jgi:hypothetical protein
LEHGFKENFFVIIVLRCQYLDYIASDNRIIKELRSGKDFEENVHGLFSEFAYSDWVKPQKSHNSRDLVEI